MSSLNSFDKNELKDFKEIGRGGFGTVYSAVWIRNIKVAVKVFNDNIDNNDKALKEYKEEVKKLMKLNHKKVVNFYGETQIDGKNAFFMELADGSLNDLIHKNEQNYSFAKAIGWLIDVAEGVIFMHENKIIHRDLKPGNLLVFQESDDPSKSTIKISDFGISREKHTSETTMTSEIGTPAYMAPEVIRGRKYDRRCDVYSFGIIMWELFSRQKPFAGLSHIQIMFNVITGQRPRSETVNFFLVTKDILDLMEKCWDDDYEKRLEMDDVLINLESIGESVKNSSLDLALEEKITTTSIDNWFLLKLLPTKLKRRVRLAAVFDSEAMIVTDNDEVYRLKGIVVDQEIEIQTNEIEQLSGLKIINMVYTRGFHSKQWFCVFALTYDGKVFAWSNTGQTLLNSTEMYKFDQVDNFITDKTIVRIDCGINHLLALTSDGEVLVCGYNKYGQLGTGGSEEEMLTEPVKVTEEIGSRRTVEVACSRYSSFAIMENGEVYTWGIIQYGYGVQKTPKRVEGLDGVKIFRLACGQDYVLALTDNGSMFAWRQNYRGHLEPGDIENKSKPVKVGPDDVKFIEVAASKSVNDISVALSEDGRFWIYDSNFNNPKPVESTSIYDAMAEYADPQMACKSMLICNTRTSNVKLRTSLGQRSILTAQIVRTRENQRTLDEMTRQLDDKESARAGHLY